MRLRRCGLPVGILLLSVAAWCQDSEPMRLVGVGSTFPLHLYSRWLPEFEKARRDIHVSYLPFGSVVSASPANIAAAGLGCVKSVTGDFRCSITNAAGEGAYPIASFTWFVVPESGSSPEKQEAVKDLLRWILKKGQSQATKTSLVKVPDRVVEEELRAIERMP